MIDKASTDSLQVLFVLLLEVIKITRRTRKKDLPDAKLGEVKVYVLHGDLSGITVIMPNGSLRKVPYYLLEPV